MTPTPPTMEAPDDFSMNRRPPVTTTAVGTAAATAATPLSIAEPGKNEEAPPPPAAAVSSSTTRATRTTMETTEKEEEANSSRNAAPPRVERDRATAPQEQPVAARPEEKEQVAALSSSSQQQQQPQPQGKPGGAGADLAATTAPTAAVTSTTTTATVTAAAVATDTSMNEETTTGVSAAAPTALAWNAALPLVELITPPQQPPPSARSPPRPEEQEEGPVPSSSPQPPPQGTLSCEADVTATTVAVATATTPAVAATAMASSRDEETTTGGVVSAATTASSTSRRSHRPAMTGSRNSTSGRNRSGRAAGTTEEQGEGKQRQTRQEPGPSTVLRPRILRSHSAATTSSSALPMKKSKTKGTTTSMATPEATPPGKKKTGNTTTTATKKQMKNGTKNKTTVIAEDPAAAATTAVAVFPCQRCHTPFESYQARNAHVQFCRKAEENAIAKTASSSKNPLRKNIINTGEARKEPANNKRIAMTKTDSSTSKNPFWKNSNTGEAIEEEPTTTIQKKTRRRMVRRPSTTTTTSSRSRDDAGGDGLRHTATAGTLVRGDAQGGRVVGRRPRVLRSGAATTMAWAHLTPLLLRRQRQPTKTTTTAAHDDENKHNKNKNNRNTEQGKGNGTHVKNTRKKNGNGNHSTPEVVSRDGSKLEEGDDAAMATAEDTTSNPHEQHCRRPRLVRAAKAPPSLPLPSPKTMMTTTTTKAAHQDKIKKSSSSSSNKATTPETGREAKQKYKTTRNEDTTTAVHPQQEGGGRRPRLLRAVTTKKTMLMAPSLPPQKKKKRKITTSQDDGTATKPKKKQKSTTTNDNDDVVEENTTNYEVWIGRTILRDDEDEEWDEAMKMEGTITNAFRYKNIWYFRIRYEQHVDAAGNVDEEDISFPQFQKTCTFITTADPTAPPSGTTTVQRKRGRPPKRNRSSRDPSVIAAEEPCAEGKDGNSKGEKGDDRNTAVVTRSSLAVMTKSNSDTPGTTNTNRRSKSSDISTSKRSYNTRLSKAKPSTIQDKQDDDATTTKKNKKKSKKRDDRNEDYTDWIGRRILRDDDDWDEEMKMKGTIMNAYEYKNAWYFRIRYEDHFDTEGNVDEEDIGLKEFEKSCTFITHEDDDNGSSDTGDVQQDQDQGQTVLLPDSKEEYTALLIDQQETKTIVSNLPEEQDQKILPVQQQENQTIVSNLPEAHDQTILPVQQDKVLSEQQPRPKQNKSLVLPLVDNENQYQHFVISTRAAETTNAELTSNVTAATAAESSLMMLPPIPPSTAIIPTATAKTKTKQTIAALSLAAVPKIQKSATKTTTAATILKKKKDPNAPKKNRSAYNYYFSHIMPSIKKDHPYTKEGVGHYSRIIGAKFKKLTDIERKQWDDAAASDKERYHRDMKEYNEKKKKDCCLPVVAAAAVKNLTKTTTKKKKKKKKETMAASLSSSKQQKQPVLMSSPWCQKACPPATAAAAVELSLLPPPPPLLRSQSSQQRYHKHQHLLFMGRGQKPFAATTNNPRFDDEDDTWVHQHLQQLAGGEVDDGVTYPAPPPLLRSQSSQNRHHQHQQLLFVGRHTTTTKTKNPRFDDEALSLHCQQQQQQQQQQAWTHRRVVDDNSFTSPPPQQQQQQQHPPQKKKRTTTKKKEKKKNKRPFEGPPKKPMTAYTLFDIYFRPIIEDENPDANFSDISRIISTKYNALTADEHNQLEGMAKRDKKRYQRKLKEYSNCNSTNNNDNSNPPRTRRATVPVVQFLLDTSKNEQERVIELQELMEEVESTSPQKSGPAVGDGYNDGGDDFCFDEKEDDGGYQKLVNSYDPNDPLSSLIGPTTRTKLHPNPFRHLQSDSSSSLSSSSEEEDEDDDDEYNVVNNDNTNKYNDSIDDPIAINEFDEKSSYDRLLQDLSGNEISIVVGIFGDKEGDEDDDEEDEKSTVNGDEENDGDADDADDESETTIIAGNNSSSFRNSPSISVDAAAGTTRQASVSFPTTPGPYIPTSPYNFLTPRAAAIVAADTAAAVATTPSSALGIGPGGSPTQELDERVLRLIHSSCISPRPCNQIDLLMSNLPPEQRQHYQQQQQLIPFTPMVSTRKNRSSRNNCYQENKSGRGSPLPRAFFNEYKGFERLEAANITGNDENRTTAEASIDGNDGVGNGGYYRVQNNNNNSNNSDANHSNSKNNDEEDSPLSTPALLRTSTGELIAIANNVMEDHNNVVTNIKRGSVHHRRCEQNVAANAMLTMATKGFADVRDGGGNGSGSAAAAAAADIVTVPTTGATVRTVPCINGGTPIKGRIKKRPAKCGTGPTTSSTVKSISNSGKKRSRMIAPSNAVAASKVIKKRRSLPMNGAGKSCVTVTKKGKSITKQNKRQISTAVTTATAATVAATHTDAGVDREFPKKYGRAPKNNPITPSSLPPRKKGKCVISHTSKVAGASGLESVLLVCPSPIADSAYHHDTKWHNYFNQAEEFVATNGHCRIPLSAAGGLGTWMKRQQDQYNVYLKYSTDPSTTVISKTVFDGVNQGVYNKRKAGGKNDPNNNDDDDEEVEMSWGSRVVRCQLNPERVQDLKNIGFISNLHEEESNWINQFETLKAYLKLNDDKYPDKYDHFELFTWVATQRYQMSKLVQGKQSFLTPDRISKMKEISFLWTEPT